MDTKAKVEVHIPKHKCRRGYGDGNSKVMITKLPNKTTFRCPGCGKKFPLEGILYITPKCVILDGNYECSLTKKELYFHPRRGEVMCINFDCPEKHRCTIGYAGIFEEKIQGAFKPGFYNESGLVNQGSQHSKGYSSKMNSIPFTMLRDLGLKGFNISNDPLKLKAVIEGILEYDDLMEFTLEGEPRKPKKIKDNLYDIQDDRFWLFHKHECIVEYKENKPDLFEKDEKPSHVCALIEKDTHRMYIIPKVSKNIFGFHFQGGSYYAYFPQKGNNLTDGDAFKDNTRFIAYKVKEIFPNPKKNGRDKIYGYLVKSDKIDEFKALTKRPTRIFSSDDYSGIPKYQKEILSKIKLREEIVLQEEDEGTGQWKKTGRFEMKNPKGILEIIDEDFTLKEYYELCNLCTYDSEPHHALQCDITDFENINIMDVIQDLKEEHDDVDEERIIELYDKFVKFIDEYCDDIYGDMEEVLNDLDDDVHNPNNIDFTRNLDKFRVGDPLQEEYHEYSNYDLIQASKHKHEMKLVRTTSAKNQQAIKDLKAAGTLKDEDPCRENTAQDVAFDYESEYSSLANFAEHDPHVKSVKIFGDKPQDEWSLQDYERYSRGEDVREIRSIVIGMNASEDDPITRHCLYGEPLPTKYDGRVYEHRTICVSGSRVMSPSLRTYKDEYGQFITPAVNVWKGYFIENGIRLLFARCAKGSDCAAIVAAIEINEYLYKKAKSGIITKEQYHEMYITIVIVGHGWYKSIDYNNSGLTAIIDRALNYDGYFISDEPYRQKRGTETTVSALEYLDERENRLQCYQTYDAKSQRFKPHLVERFHWFDRRLERANKRLVSLGGPTSKLVILCRSTYSGTTNTMNFAIEAGKEVVEITSPTREPPIDWRSENDPIQKGHSDLEYYKEYWDTILMMTPAFINDYAGWYQEVNNYNKCHGVRKVPNYLAFKRDAIAQVQVRRVEYKRKARHVNPVVGKYHDPANIQHKQASEVVHHKTIKYSSKAVVPVTISNYAKWYNVIDQLKGRGLYRKGKSSTPALVKWQKHIAIEKKNVEEIRRKPKTVLTEEEIIKRYPQLKEKYEKWANFDYEDLTNKETERLF